MYLLCIQRFQFMKTVGGHLRIQPPFGGGGSDNHTKPRTDRLATVEGGEVSSDFEVYSFHATAIKEFSFRKNNNKAPEAPNSVNFYSKTLKIGYRWSFGVEGHFRALGDHDVKCPPPGSANDHRHPHSRGQQHRTVTRFMWLPNESSISEEMGQNLITERNYPFKKHNTAIM